MCRGILGQSWGYWEVCRKRTEFSSWSRPKKLITGSLINTRSALCYSHPCMPQDFSHDRSPCGQAGPKQDLLYACTCRAKPSIQPKCSEISKNPSGSVRAVVYVLAVRKHHKWALWMHENCGRLFIHEGALSGMGSCDVRVLFKQIGQADDYSLQELHST